MNRNLIFLFVFALVSACQPDVSIGRQTDDASAPTDEVVYLPAASCAPACSDDGPPPPPGMEGPSTCYDGCNWCYCTDEGPAQCTARFCGGDAGTPSDGEVVYLPAASCAPACSDDGPPPPPGMEGPSTCYDGCNWCYCTNEGPAQCTARLCEVDGGTP